jgi:polyphosphate kinase 2 (PPK2 family)
MLNSVDLTKKLDRATYKQKLIDHQLRLRELAHELYVQKRSLVVVVEGWDAAGKGGAIRRVTEKIDPRGYQVYAIAAPAGDDKTHHYLWRFWRRLRPPEDKQIVVFDRSWYGRVLVERVEGFATPEEWKRAYREINEFERQLTDKGIMLAKLWFHVSLEEQLSRFEARQGTPHKAWKLTGEDWRNREKWDQYVEAVEDMVLKTSTRTAPWSIIEGNDKLWARIRTQEVLIDAITANLDLESKTKSDQPKKDKQKKD